MSFAAVLFPLADSPSQAIINICSYTQIKKCLRKKLNKKKLKKKLEL